MIPCVVLASQKKRNVPREELEAFNMDYFDFLPGQVRAEPQPLYLHDPDDQDGGNGSGLEPAGESRRLARMDPSISSLRKTFWDFLVTLKKSSPPARTDRDKRFPPPMRFEVCLLFNDVGQAQHFLARESAGQRLCRIFQFVELVALSAPAFSAMPGKAQEYR